MTRLSSADEDDQQHRDGAEAAPSAEEITDPTLQAEIANPAEANPPTGEDAAPGGGVTAADREPLPAAGAPDELVSDQTPAQGDEQGEAVPAEPLDAGGESPETQPADQKPDRPEGKPDEPTERQAEPAREPTGEPAVVAEQPPPTASSAVSQGMAVAQAEADKAAMAERAGAGVASPAGSATAVEEEPPPGEVDEARTALIDRLRGSLGDGVVGSHILPGVDAWVRVSLDVWEAALRVCRDELGLTYFCYLSAIDWLPSPYGRSEDAGEDAGDEAGDEGGDDSSTEQAPTKAASATIETGYAGGDTRFQLLARLVSPTSHLGLTLKTDLDDEEPRAPTVTAIFAGADWHEREAWEMYGIDFTGHPGLRHLYLPGAFEGHPLRKDFPLLAREVKPWPGLVDVEAMPGEPDAANGEAAS